MPKKILGIIALLFVTLLSFLVPNHTLKAQPPKTKCESLADFVAKFNPTDEPGKCYVGSSANVQIIQWVDPNKALAVINYGFLKKKAFLIPYTDITYGRKYTFVYRGTLSYRTVLGALETAPVFEVFDFSDRTVLGSFLIVVEKKGKNGTTVRLIPSERVINLGSRYVKIKEKNRIKTLPAKKVVGILRLEKRIDDNKNECSLKTMGRYKNLDPSVQVNLLDSLCTPKAMEGKPIKVKLK
jgi:hypothetical protein